MKRSALIFAACALIIMLCLNSTAVARDTKLADFSLKDINKKTVRLKNFIGEKVILIDFWATWCKPCVREMVHLEKMYREFQNRDFVIFGISVDNTTTVSRVKPFVKANKYTFPILLDTNSTVVKLYNPTKTLPYSILIDKKGNIVRTHKGYSDGDENILREEILKLIGTQEDKEPDGDEPVKMKGDDDSDDDK